MDAEFFFLMGRPRVGFLTIPTRKPAFVVETPGLRCIKKGMSFSVPRALVTRCAATMGHPSFLAAGWAVVSVLLATQFFPWAFRLNDRVALASIERGSGLAWVGQPERPLPKFREPRVLPLPRPSVEENGVVLPGGKSSQASIERYGFGRFRIQRDRVLFAPSAEDIPVVPGMYAVVFPRFRLPEIVTAGLLTLWAVMTRALLLNAAFRKLRNRFGMGPPSAVPRIPFLAPLPVLAGLCLTFALAPSRTAAAFCGEPALLLVWAFGAVLAGMPSSRFRWGLQGAYVAFFLAMSWQHYAIDANSQTFSLAGTIPFSDAAGHASQATDLLKTGWSEWGFNGRMLYPLTLALAMAVCGGNLQAANLVLLAIVLIALLHAGRIVANRTGWLGATAFLALVGAYIQVFANMTCMHETPGVLIGLLTVAFLLENRPWAALCAMSFGNAIRPGALFVMLGPALTLMARLWGTRETPRFPRRAFLTLAAIGVAAVIGFVVNAASIRLLIPHPVASYGNAMYSFYSVVTNTHWTEGMRVLGRDTSGAPRVILEQAIARPDRFAQGLLRAYQRMFVAADLFRFGKRGTTASLIMVVFLLGVAFCACSPEWANIRLLLLGSLGGFVCSVPLAPTWDTGMRSYAAALPLIAVFVAAGVGWIFAATHVPRSPTRTSFVLAGCLVAIPLVGMAWMLWTRASGPPAPAGPFKPGTHLFIVANTEPEKAGSITERTFRLRTADFREEWSDPAFLADVRPGTVLAWDWSSTPAVGVLVFPDSAGVPRTPRDGIQVGNDILSTAP